MMMSPAREKRSRRSDGTGDALGLKVVGWGLAGAQGPPKHGSSGSPEQGGAANDRLAAFFCPGIEDVLIESKS